MNNNFIGIHHDSFIVSDLENAKFFYNKILGLPINSNRPEFSFDGLWLDINNQQQLHLVVKKKNQDLSNLISNQIASGRDRHTALSVIDLSLIETTLDNNEINYKLSKSGRRALFCSDPDGNTIEILEK